MVAVGTQPGRDFIEGHLVELRQGIFRAVQAYLGKQFVGRGALPTEEAHHLAEDCTQEALLAVLNNLTGFRGDSQFTTWVYAIAIRTVLGGHRRNPWNSKAVKARRPAPRASPPPASTSS